MFLFLEYGVRKGSKLSPAVLEQKLRDFNFKPVESSEVLEDIEQELAAEEAAIRIEKHTRKEQVPKMISS